MEQMERNRFFSCGSEVKAVSSVFLEYCGVESAGFGADFL